MSGGIGERHKALRGRADAESAITQREASFGDGQIVCGQYRSSEVELLHASAELPDSEGGARRHEEPPADDVFGAIEARDGGRSDGIEH